MTESPPGLPEPPFPSRWPAWRAALLTLVIAVHLLYAAPLPHTISDAELQTATAREEVRRWTERLAGLGIVMTTDEFKTRLQAFTNAIGGAHRAAKEPFRPIMNVTGTGQGWALFVNPNLRPDRFELRVQRKGRFEIRYRQHDPDRAWWRTRLRYRRVRGCWSAGMGRRPARRQRRFARWIASTIFEAEPEIQAIQTRMHRTPTGWPGHPPRGKARYLHDLLVDRTDLENRP